jgi:predicted negative regulator of RcsB-dependent stress response
MALDLEEQEQLDAVKAWWKAHGIKVVAGVTLFVVGVAGFRLWGAYQHKQLNEASAIFQTLAREFSSGDAQRIRSVAGEIIDKYPRTIYAVDAALLAAKVNFDSGDLKSAKAQLQWVIDHARDTQSQDIARLRLAGILLDEKSYDEAVKLLDAKHDSAFDGLYSDLKGDVLATQGKTDEARKAYQAALEKMPDNSPARPLVQTKLDALESAG